MKTLLIAITVLILAGCSQSPVLYQNAKYNKVGKSQADRDIEVCKEKAEKAGAHSDNVKKSAQNAGRGAVAGAASGAVGSAIYGGNVGRGVGAGAAAGATSTFIWGVLSPEPDPVFRGYVDECLRERGYKPIGWS